MREAITFAELLLAASMRPGQISPGNVKVRRGEILRAKPASMRPGQISPGNQQLVCEGADVIQASMRPGQISPGNRRRRHPHDRGHGCFNEARADQPGK